ncbi:MAG: hypothetical protein UW92_C0024G0016, partial [Candidatus Jorgensenbacteria bacterium GW2011_GWA2_45_13]
KKALFCIVVSLLRICAKVRPLGKIYKGSSLEELEKLRSEKLEESKEGSLGRLQKKGVSLEEPEEKDSDEFRKK